MTTTSLAAGAVAVPRAMRVGARVSRRRSIARRRTLTAPRAGFLDDMGVGDLGTSPPSSSAPVELANSIGSAVGRTYTELFPDLPSEVLGVSVPDTARALADAARPATDAAFQTLPDDAKSGLSDWWQREVDSGFTLVTGNAEYELALALLVVLWATGRPGEIGRAHV